MCIFYSFHLERGYSLAAKIAIPPELTSRRLFQLKLPFIYDKDRRIIDRDIEDPVTAALGTVCLIDVSGTDVNADGVLKEAPFTVTFSRLAVTLSPGAAESSHMMNETFLLPAFWNSYTERDPSVSTWMLSAGTGLSIQSQTETRFCTAK
jgi:hypothetical protein